MVRAHSGTTLTGDNCKFLLKTTLFGQSFSFIDNKAHKLKENSIFLSAGSLYYLCLHLRLSSPFYLMQLVDIFSYETALNVRPSYLGGGLTGRNVNSFSKSTSSLIVYNFHSLPSQNRLYVFSGDLFPSSKSTRAGFTSALFSISELFYSAN